MHRIAWVDFAKGLVMILVVLGHAIKSNLDLSKLIFVFHMPFFFIMAGFLLNLDKWSGAENYKNFTLKLAKRLLLPYYLAEFLWYPIWFFAGHVLGHTAYIRNPDLSPLEALFGIFIGNGNMLALVPLWFLPALFFSEIIFIKLHNRFAKAGDDIFTLILVAISYSGYLIGKFFFLPLSLDVSLTAQGFLFIGVLIKKYNVVEKLNLRNCLVLLNVFTIVFILNGKISMCQRIYGDLFLLYMGGISGTLLTIKFSMIMMNVGGKFFALMKYCGRQSLFVMTIHLIIAFAVYDFVVNISGLNVFIVRSLPEVILSITLFGLTIPLFIAKKFGKLPVLKYFCV